MSFSDYVPSWLYPTTWANAASNLVLSEDYKNGLRQDLAQSTYDFKYLSFPGDLGMDDVGHYMVININVPTNADQTTPAGNYRGYFKPVEPITRSKVDTLRYGSPGSAIVNTAGSPSAPLFNIPRFTRRIQESIAVYTPTPLVFNSHNAYEEVSLTALAGKLTIGAIQGAGFLMGAGKALQGALGNAAKVVGTATGAAVGSSTVSDVLKLTGNPINPMVEILFANTPVRQFAFELLMAPRNEQESISIQSIIKTLRFHAAPEINTGGIVRGLQWIPPAEFDITFFNKGVENTNILRINTCVLERIEVDFAPSAGIFSTFRNGHPVAVRMSLGFRELEPVHKQRVLQGF